MSCKSHPGPVTEFHIRQFVSEQTWGGKVIQTISNRYCKAAAHCGCDSPLPFPHVSLPTILLLVQSWSWPMAAFSPLLPFITETPGEFFSFFLIISLKLTQFSKTTSGQVRRVVTVADNWQCIKVSDSCKAGWRSENPTSIFLCKEVQISFSNLRNCINLCCCFCRRETKP